MDTGHVDVKMVIRGLVVEIHPHLTGLQTIFVLHSLEARLFNVIEKGQVAPVEISE